MKKYAALLLGSIILPVQALAFAPEFDYPIFYFSSSSQPATRGDQTSSLPPREVPQSSEQYSSYEQRPEYSSYSSYHEEVYEEDEGETYSKASRSAKAPPTRYSSSSKIISSSKKSSARSSNAPASSQKSSEQRRVGGEVESDEETSSSESSSSSRSRSSMSSHYTASGFLMTFGDPATFRRENFWYTEPIIDPDSIAMLDDLGEMQEVFSENASLAVLITLFVGITGLMLNSLFRTHPKLLEKLLQRLPLQVVITIILYWALGLLMPSAFAQEFSLDSDTSLLHIPLFALLFFIVVGLTNSVFNNFITAEGDKLHAIFTRVFYSEKSDHRGEGWLIVLFLLAYAVIGAHINPSFSLMPSAQVGMALVAVIAILLSGYAKDFLRYLLSKIWKYESWFKANGPGLSLALFSVFMARTFDLNPGYIYGLPIGLFIVSKVYEKKQGVFEFLGMIWMIGLGILVWLLAPYMSGYEVIYDFLLLSFVILAEGAFFEMMPFPYQSGGPIFRWNPLIWAVQFALVVFLVFQTIVNRTGTLSSLEQSKPALATLLLVGCYVVGVILLWVAVKFTKKKK